MRSLLYILIKREQRDNFRTYVNTECESKSVNPQVFQRFTDPMWNPTDMKHCYLDGSPLEFEIKYSSDIKNCF